MIRQIQIHFFILVIGSVFFLSSFEAAAQTYEGQLIASNESNLERYGSKDRSDRQNFDRNLGKYQTLSPREKKEKLDKWRDFKSNTTEEERDFIKRKMRRERRR